MSASGPMRYPTLAAVIVCGFFAMGAEWVTCDDNAEPPAVSSEASEGGGVRFACKSNLRNRYEIWVRALATVNFLPVSEGKVSTDWCWYTAGRNGIKSRSSTPAFACVLPVGGCSSGADYWASSDCSGAGPDSCLTRREQQTVVSASVAGIQLNTSLWRCIATRIYSTGGHTRNIVHGRCPGGDAQAAAVRSANLTLEDFVSPRVARQIRSACWGPLARATAKAAQRSGYCRRKLLRAYRSLSAAKRAEVRAYFEGQR
jgi:hypothetical protein